MRLLTALAYIAFGMWVLFQLVESPSFILGISTFFALMFSSTFLFNKHRLAKIKRQSIEEYTQELERKGRLLRDMFESHRAFCFEDLNTGCMAYFLDVGSRGVLCLYGQYLYDYEPITDDKELNQERKFPCERFVLLKDRSDRDFLHLVLEGRVFELEIIKQPHHKILGDLGIKLENGELLSNFQYDQLRSALS